MSGRWAAVALWLTVAAALGLSGCGDDDSSDAGLGLASTTSTTAAPPAAELPPAVPEGTLELVMTSDDSVPAGPHTWALELRNVTDQAVTVTFPTSQLADVVLRDGDTVVHRWSDGRFFTQQVTEETIAAGGALPIALDDDLSGVEPGSYDAELTTTALGSVEPTSVGVLVTAP